jgi:mRNA interferase RelE/StbE
MPACPTSGAVFWSADLRPHEKAGGYVCSRALGQQQRSQHLLEELGASVPEAERLYPLGCAIRFLASLRASSGTSGYDVARMRFEITLFPAAARDLHRLSAFERAKVRDAIEVHLRHEPTKISKSRIKRLRELTHPQFRLKVGDLRVFYDVEGEEVQILAIVAKADADAWLDQVGQGDENSSTLGSEG